MSGNVPKEIYDTYFSTFNEQIKKLNIEIVTLKASHSNQVKSLNTKIETLQNENNQLKKTVEEAEKYPMNKLVEREMKRMVQRITELEGELAVNKYNKTEQVQKDTDNVPRRKTLSEQQSEINKKKKKSFLNIFK